RPPASSSPALAASPRFPCRDAPGRRSGPRKALRAHPVSAFPQRADLLRARHRRPQPGLRQRRPDQGQPEPRGDRVLRPLETGVRIRPAHADHGPEGHHPADPRRTRRPRREIFHPADALTQPHPPDQRSHQHRLQADHLDRPAATTSPKFHESTGVTLTSYPGTVRQLVVTGPGRDAPTVIISNDYEITTRALIERYARRMTTGQRLAEIIQGFCADALSSAVNLNVDLDVVLCVLAQALLAAFRLRLPGNYAHATPDTLQRRFPGTPGEIISTPTGITVKINRRAYSPVLRHADLPADTTVPWWDGRQLRFEFARPRAEVPVRKSALAPVFVPMFLTGLRQLKQVGVPAKPIAHDHAARHKTALFSCAADAVWRVVQRVRDNYRAAVTVPD